MGMDVYGRAPNSKQGEYFRNTVWYWHPLAILCKKLVPEIAQRCEAWHYNLGYGLDRDCAQRLGTKLNELLNDGTVERHCREIRLDLIYGDCPLCHCNGSHKLLDDLRADCRT